MSKPLGLALLFLLLAGIGAGAQERGTPRQLYQRGREAQSRVQLLRAVELYRAALQSNPDYLEPMVGLAETFFALEEYREALDHVTRARRYDRENLDLRILEGRIRLGLAGNGILSAGTSRGEQ